MDVIHTPKKNLVQSIELNLQNYEEGANGLEVRQKTLNQVDQDFKPYEAIHELQREGTLRYITFTLLLKKHLEWKLDDFLEPPKPRRHLTWLSSTLSAHFFGHLNVVSKAVDAVEESRQ